MNEPYSFTFYTASWYRRSPYWQRSVEAGCRSWDLYNHMLIPTLYDDDEAEYWHLVNHVTLWDVAVERQVEITGPDAAAFTQLLTCRDLSRCEVLQCKYAPIIAPGGGIVNDPILLRLGEDRFWEGSVGDIPVVVSRTGWSGEVGFEIYLCDGARGTELWDRVMKAGRPFEIRAIAPSDQRRLEAGIFNYGNDMG